MASEREHKTVYFSEVGAENTDRTLVLAKTRAKKLGIKQIVVATTSGATALKAAEIFGDLQLVVVTHSTGFRKPDVQEMDASIRENLENIGVTMLTSTHIFGGVGRAVRKKLNTFELEEIMAHTLRTFGQGVKVGIEITLMAADAGLIRTDQDTIAIGGTDNGADTAIVIKPTHTQTFFDLKVREIICKPW